MLLILLIEVHVRSSIQDLFMRVQILFLKPIHELSCWIFA